MKNTYTVLLLVILCFTLCMLSCSDDKPIVSGDAATSAQAETNGPIEPESNTIPTEYDAVLNNIIKAYPWNDDDMSMVPENPELSYMYRRNTSLSEIGFALLDIDGNGQKELIISALNSPFIYDMYTVTDEGLSHIFDSGERYSFYLYENGIVENQWSASAANSGHDFFVFKNGALQLTERIALDAFHALDAGLIKDLSEANGDNCYFTSKTDKPEDYRHITSEEATNTVKAYQNENKPLKINFTLLSEYGK